MVDLLGVDAEFFEERRLVVESGAADATDRGGELRRGGEGGGGGGGVDIEGEEGETSVRRSGGLEGSGGEAPLLGAGRGGSRITAGRENNRRHVEFLRHGSELEIWRETHLICLASFVVKK